MGVHLRCGEIRVKGPLYIWVEYIGSVHRNSDQESYHPENYSSLLAPLHNLKIFTHTAFLLE